MKENHKEITKDLVREAAIAAAAVGVTILTENASQPVQALAIYGFVRGANELRRAKGLEYHHQDDTAR